MTVGILDRSESRRGTPVRVLAVHTTEGGGTAQALRDAAWWTGSSHAIADEATLLTPAEGCVPYDRAAWTLRSGNLWSENIEIVGYAKWSRADWLARPGRLAHVARWLADRSKARGIPLVKLTPQQYRAGGRGVIGHHDHTVGYSDGTHWDPGPGFPWDIVLDKARAYAAGKEGFLMALTDAQQQEIYDWLRGSHPQADTLTVLYRQHQDMPRAVWWDAKVTRAGEDGDTVQVPALQELADTKTLAASQAGQIAGMQAALAAVATGQPIDLAAVQAAARAGAEEALAQGVGVDITVGGKPSAATRS